MFSTVYQFSIDKIANAFEYSLCSSNSGRSVVTSALNHKGFQHDHVLPINLPKFRPEMTTQFASMSHQFSDWCRVPVRSFGRAGFAIILPRAFRAFLPAVDNPFPLDRLVSDPESVQTACGATVETYYDSWRCERCSRSS